MQTILQTMKQYNKAIESFKRAEEYFARDEIPIEEKISRADDCKSLVNHLHGLSLKIKYLGYSMTNEEYIEGFRQIKFLKL